MCVSLCLLIHSTITGSSGKKWLYAECIKFNKQMHLSSFHVALHFVECVCVCVFECHIISPIRSFGVDVMKATNTLAITWWRSLYVFSIFSSRALFSRSSMCNVHERWKDRMPSVYLITLTALKHSRPIQYAMHIQHFACACTSVYGKD